MKQVPQARQEVLSGSRDDVSSFAHAMLFEADVRDALRIAA